MARLMPLALLAALARPGLAADGPPLLELHVWGGNEAADSGHVGLRSAELASWVTRRDRFAVAFDNSLSLDNPALARAGVAAEAWSVGYLHDFSGRFLTSAWAGRRDLANGATQDIYKLELVRLQEGRVAKFGAQLSPTRDGAVRYTDGVVYGALNFPVSPRVRFEPAVFVGRTGTAGDVEWRFSGYTEFNAHNGTQIGIGVSGGRVRSSLEAGSGSVFAAHARVSWPIVGNQLLHLQVKHEVAPGHRYTLGLVGLSLRIPRR
jgi:hypothetical protein